MMKFRRVHLFIVFFVLLRYISPASAHDMYKKVFSVGVVNRIALTEKQRGGQWYGFKVETFREIMHNSHLAFRFVEYMDQQSLYNAVVTGDVDMMLSTLAIRNDLRREVVFSFPYTRAGSSLVALDREENYFINSVLKSFFSVSVWKIVLGFLFLIFGFGNIFWLLERRKTYSGIARRYIPGIFDSMWFAFVVNSHVHVGHEKVKDCHWISRVITIPLWLLGLLVTSLIISQLVTEFSLVRLQRIQENALVRFQDSKVAVIEGSLEESFLLSSDFRNLVPVKGFPEMRKMLLNKELDALVYDDMAALHMVDIAKTPLHIEATGLVPEFQSIVINKTLVEMYPTLKPRLDSVIIDLTNDGTISEIDDKWKYLHGDASRLTVAPH